MHLSFAPDPIVRHRTCPSCKAPFTSVQHTLLNHNTGYGVAFVELHSHSEPEVFITITLGTWGHDRVDDHVTFSCRYGATHPHGKWSCSLVDVSLPHEPILGRILTRTEALHHPRLAEFWGAVDYIIAHDEHIAGLPTSQ